MRVHGPTVGYWSAMSFRTMSMYHQTYGVTRLRSLQSLMNYMYLRDFIKSVSERPKLGFEEIPELFRSFGRCSKDVLKDGRRELNSY